MPKISALTALAAGAVAASDLLAIVDASAVETKSITTTALRTALFAGTGMTATDPLVVGNITASGTLAVTGASTLTGNVGVGGASDAGAAIYLRATALTGTTQRSVLAYSTFSSGATSAGIAVYGAVNTAVAAFTMATGYAFAAGAPTVGADSAITTLYGYHAANQGAIGIANAYGVYIAAQSGASTTNIGLYNAGTTTLVGAVSMGGALAITGALSGVTTLAASGIVTFGIIGVTNAIINSANSMVFAVDSTNTLTGQSWLWRTNTATGTGGTLCMTLGDDGTLTLTGALTTNGGLQTFGANDSAGAGYRLVRVPNV